MSVDPANVPSDVKQSLEQEEFKRLEAHTNEVLQGMGIKPETLDIKKRDISRKNYESDKAKVT